MARVLDSIYKKFSDHDYRHLPNDDFKVRSMRMGGSFKENENGASITPINFESSFRPVDKEYSEKPPTWSSGGFHPLDENISPASLSGQPSTVPDNAYKFAKVTERDLQDRALFRSNKMNSIIDRLAGGSSDVSTEDSDSFVSATSGGGPSGPSAIPVPKASLDDVRFYATHKTRLAQEAYAGKLAKESGRTKQYTKKMKEKDLSVEDARAIATQRVEDNKRYYDVDRRMQQPTGGGGGGALPIQPALQEGTTKQQKLERVKKAFTGLKQGTRQSTKERKLWQAGEIAKDMFKEKQKKAKKKALDEWKDVKDKRVTQRRAVNKMAQIVMKKRLDENPGRAMGKLKSLPKKPTAQVAPIQQEERTTQSKAVPATSMLYRVQIPETKLSHATLKTVPYHPYYEAQPVKPSSTGAKKGLSTRRSTTTIAPTGAGNVLDGIIVNKNKVVRKRRNIFDEEEAPPKRSLKPIVEIVKPLKPKMADKTPKPFNERFKHSLAKAEA